MGKDHKNAVSAKKLEPLYIVEKRGQEVVITGFTERNAAEKLGVRHLTVIIVPFVADGKKGAGGSFTIAPPSSGPRAKLTARRPVSISLADTPPPTLPSLT